MSHFSIKTDGPFGGGHGSIVFLVISISILLLSGQSAIGCNFQDETFDIYPNGSSMHGQGGWEGWGGDPAFTA
ncbi:MAG: hypothetical protein ACYS6W_07270, partial [Planctomycetota bacterium]